MDCTAFSPVQCYVLFIQIMKHARNNNPARPLLTGLMATRVFDSSTWMDY